MKKQEILDAFMFRHACKEFDATKKIPKDDFSFILETGRLSPSSFGLEPWHFLVIQNQDLRETLVKAAWGGQKQFPTASHLVFVLTRKSHFMKYDSDYIDGFMVNVQGLPPEIVEMRKGFYEAFQAKDFKLLESERAMTDWAARQTYIPLANMMTSAAMIGVDSCPMEGFDRETMDALLASELGMDRDKFTLGYAVAFGYRKEAPMEKTRQEMEAVTTWYE
ncbi:NAD(P)H-dependent oxidoreductase [Desulfoluna spongiiphila]|uniref:Nitroreductase n=1 Tax=Desulfoluna spongiiphila TaxID=419481 RepID=A0A1G5F6F9_9BACT|nr:NAD(P)H-dependent oxidoreductase [Desulfoluna spongiiphila]SCY34774.1 Nitroreductase [Desulfoluna spongiiphila]VVS94273.1 nitroreductase [Desulfoluna spongiiphila]